jgi:hypothetical protein
VTTEAIHGVLADLYRVGVGILCLCNMFAHSAAVLFSVGRCCDASIWRLFCGQLSPQIAVAMFERNVLPVQRSSPVLKAAPSVQVTGVPNARRATGQLCIKSPQCACWKRDPHILQSLFLPGVTERLARKVGASKLFDPQKLALANRSWPVKTARI